MGEAFLKCVGEGPKPMTRFSSLTTRAGSGLARNCKRGEGIISTFFPALFFFNKTNSKLIKKQEKLSGGPGACSSGKFLKIYMV